jgi:valyl-tRNA synthetase
MGELVDIAAETQRLTKELEVIKSEIARAKGKLANKGFVEKAPARLVEAEKEKIEKFTQQKEMILQSLKRLQEI